MMTELNQIKKIWWISLAVKLVLSAILPINADESYYWVWSHHLQLSYYDHPAAVAWLFYLGHFLEPLGQAVRWPAVLLSHGTLAVWLLILKEYLPAKNLKVFTYLMIFSPLLGIGSMIVTPDVPVMFFWSLAVYFLFQIERHAHARDYLLLGAALGLGFCSKYHIVLFVPFLFAYLLIERRYQNIRWQYVPLTILAGLVFCLPVLLWNYQNNWASFAYQLNHGLEAAKNKPEWILRYVGAEIMLLFPLVVWAALKVKPKAELKSLIYLGWGPFLFFFVTSFKGFVEANWPIVGFPAILALAANHEKMQSWLKYYIGLWGSMVAVVLFALYFPPLREVSEHLVNTFEYRQLNEEVKSYRPIYAQTHLWASMMWYFSKEPVYKLKYMNRPDFFDFIDESKPTGDHFYLVVGKNARLPDWVAKENWTSKSIKKISERFELLEFNKASTPEH